MPTEQKDIIPTLPIEAIIVPDSVKELAERSVGVFFEGVNNMPRAVAARDHLDLQRPIRAGRLLKNFTPLNGMRLLEIGSGFGINLATWIKQYELDGMALRGTQKDSAALSKLPVSFLSQMG